MGLLWLQGTWVCGWRRFPFLVGLSPHPPLCVCTVCDCHGIEPSAALHTRPHKHTLLLWSHGPEKQPPLNCAKYILDNVATRGLHSRQQLKMLFCLWDMQAWTHTNSNSNFPPLPQCLLTGAVDQVQK